MVSLKRPVGGTMTDRFGWRDPVAGLPAMLHSGQDYAAPAGTPIRAAHAGTVSRVYWDQWPDGSPGGGNMIEIAGNGFSTRYAHMQAPSKLKPGQRVTTSTVIGYVGTTGASTGPHLHFELVVNGNYVDPVPHIKKPLEDDMSAAAEKMIKELHAAICAPIKRGGGKLSKRQDDADTRTLVGELHTELVTPVSRGGKKVRMRQDLADTNTMVREVLAEVKSLNARVAKLEGK